jgi:hypothetical protein
MIHSDIIANIKFYKTEDGGRKTPTAPTFFGCIFVIGNKKHDCRLLLDKIGSIAPGDNKSNVPIKFLCPELALLNLKHGDKFYLWDMRNIAEGEVKKIVIHNKNHKPSKLLFKDPNGDYYD